MAQYYLISQLPSLDGAGENVPIPITEEHFLELCSLYLDKKTLGEIGKITLVPPKDELDFKSALIERWSEMERDLRLVLGKVRANKMNKSFDIQKKDYSDELYKIANSAIEIENPLEAENFLLRYRLSFLETLRPIDIFTRDYLYYYAIKLKLIYRIQQFDTELGEATYRNIYNSILNEDRPEA